MSRPRLRVDRSVLDGDHLRLEDKDFHYLCHVLRLGVGDSLEVFDGQGRQAVASIVALGSRSAEAVLGVAARSRPAAGPRITLVQALLKGERMDLVVQKATELGVAEIAPVTAERVVRRLEPARAERQAARWARIAQQACRQCGRSDGPRLCEVTSLAAALDARKAGMAVAGDDEPARALRLFVWEEEHERSLLHALPEDPTVLASVASVVVIVGPEGGFSNREAAQAAALGYATVGLGPRILRAETAAIAVLAILGFALGDLGAVL